MSFFFLSAFHTTCSNTH